jgi:hypothetical protein
MKIEEHHLLECIIWPNGDGTFRKIVNRAERLQKLGIYQDKLTIPIECSVHQTMHWKFENGSTENMIRKERMSIAASRRTGILAAMYGRHHNKESNEKNSKAHIGKKHSEEAKRKMSISRSGENNPFYGNHSMSGDKHPMFGRKHSEEAKAKMRAAHQRRKANYGK